MVEHDEDNEFHEVLFEYYLMFLVELKIKKIMIIKKDKKKFTYESMLVLDFLDKIVQEG
jgi:hypothetical protein